MALKMKYSHNWETKTFSGKPEELVGDLVAPLVDLREVHIIHKDRHVLS